MVSPLPEFELFTPLQSPHGSVPPNHENMALLLAALISSLEERGSLKLRDVQLVKLQIFNFLLISALETADPFGTPGGMKASTFGNAVFPVTWFSRQIRKVQSRTPLKIPKSLCYRMNLL